MVYLAVTIAVVVIAFLLAPFWLGPGGHLAPSSSINSPERLANLKETILKRYLGDEEAHKAGELSERDWLKRKEWLTHRYMDAARRLDFIQNLSRQVEADGENSGANADQETSS